MSTSSNLCTHTMNVFTTIISQFDVFDHLLILHIRAMTNQHHYCTSFCILNMLRSVQDDRSQQTQAQIHDAMQSAITKNGPPGTLDKNRPPGTLDKKKKTFP